jgi:peptide/nickel transport system substrate-binding protein
MLSRRALLAASAGVSFLSYDRLASAQTPAGIVVMAKQIDDIVSLDPAEAFEFSGTEIVGNAYQKLLTTPNDDPGKLAGDLAESWTANDDGSKFVFKLKQGPAFASGKPVTAEDVVYSLTRVVALNKSPAFIINQFGFTKDNAAERIRALDARTVELTTEPTAPSFLYYCLTAAVGSIVEKAAVEAQARDGDFGNGWLKQNSAGSGKYVIRGWRASESVTLEGNPHNAPATRRVIIRHVIDPSAQFLGLQKGDFDIVRNLGADQLKQVANDPKYKVQDARKAALMYLSLSQKNEYLAKPQVRQAIKLAIDYAAIQKNIVPTTYAVHEAFLPEGLPGALKDTPFQQNVAEAKKLLAEAGLANGFEIAFDYSSGAPIGDIAQAVQANLAAIGIRCRMLPGEMRAVITKTRARQHEIAIVRWGSDYFDPHSNAEAFSMNPDNGDNARNRTLAWRASWDIPELTQKTAAAVKDTDSARRTQTYLALQREHQQVSPFVIMLQEIEVAVTRANISGLDMGPMSDRTAFGKIAKA